MRPYYSRAADTLRQLWRWVYCTYMYLEICIFIMKILLRCPIVQRSKIILSYSPPPKKDKKISIVNTQIVDNIEGNIQKIWMCNLRLIKEICINGDTVSDCLVSNQCLFFTRFSFLHRPFLCYTWYPTNSVKLHPYFVQDFILHPICLHRLLLPLVCTRHFRRGKTGLLLRHVLSVPRPSLCE